MITPFELKPHYSTRQSPDQKIVAMFEHDIQRILVYICPDDGIWNKIYLHYDDLENHVVQQVRTRDYSTTRPIIAKVAHSK